VLLDRDGPLVESAATRLGEGAGALVADVTRTSDVDGVVQVAHDWHGRLDIVVRCARSAYRQHASRATVGRRLESGPLGSAGECRVSCEQAQTGRRPWMMRISTTAIATMSRMWM
jgi:NAD(P)-dependent dehydrogenase (short-subunit alcohol dehydrogenase family)